MRVALIGLGSIAKKHVDALYQINPQIELYALRSASPSATYRGVVNLYDFEALQEIPLDFVIVSSPTFRHKNDILKALDLNVPLFIEKPLAHIIQLDELMSKVEDKRVKTYVACNLRFLDCLNFVKEYINDNDKLNLNELNAYCGSYLPDWRPDQDYKNSYSADPDKGGGVHLDLIHELDYIYWFFGFPKQITRTLKSCSSLDIQSVDYANYILDYDTFQASVILNYFRKDAKRSLELVFDTVTLHVDLLTNTVSSNNKLIFQSEQRGLDTYKVQLEYFMNNLKKDTFNSVAEALEVLKICLPE